MILYLARQYDQAEQELANALEIDPGHFLLHFRLALIYQQRRRFGDAVKEMEKAVDLSGRSIEVLTGLAQTCAAAGLRARAEEIVEDVLAESKGRYVSAYNLARAYASLEDREQTLAWLERAYAERHPDLIELRTEPCFDGVRAEPRFTQLLSRVGF